MEVSGFENSKRPLRGTIWFGSGHVIEVVLAFKELIDMMSAPKDDEMMQRRFMRMFHSPSVIYLFKTKHTKKNLKH